MKTVHAPKKKEKGIKVQVAAPKMGNLLPISVQIQFKNMHRRCDKSKTRMKQKRDWQ